MTTVTDLLAGWMPHQRWYAAKGHVPVLRRVGGFAFGDPTGEVGVETLLLVDSATSPPVVYQVPVTHRRAPLEGGENALIGTTEDDVHGRRWVYDGPHDPLYVERLVDAILAGTQSAPVRASVGSAAVAVGVPTGLAAGHVTTSAVLIGEQSNTSVICRMAALGGGPAEPLIVKVFRTLQAGDNPDVAVQSALTRAGSHRVPAAFGHLAGGWDAPDGSGEVRGHLAFAQEFIPGVEDAWRVALAAAASGSDFRGRAHDLGVVTAEIHAALAATLGTTEASQAARDALIESMRERYAAAVAAVPDLAARSADVERVVTAAAAVRWPPLQRVHGDYHLGQVLDVPERGWVALDFEGEPLRPLDERVRPDLVQRDVAGMLRSFDYAAGSVRLAEGGRGEASAAWAAAARTAFLEGYASVAGAFSTDSDALVGALELDKALYEVVYEARNRPTWLPIPLVAVGRLLDDLARDPSRDDGNEGSAP